MANKTGIPWADYTINPIVGCQKCSPGCKNCYAARDAKRLAKNPHPAISGKYTPVVGTNGWNGKTSSYDPTVFDKLPKKPSKIFVCSMGDLFYRGKLTHNEHTVVLCKVFDWFLHFGQHTFLLLTKRPEEARKFYKEVNFPHNNVWLGVTVCNQAEAGEKIPILLDTPAAKRFISVEPMLEEMDLSKWVFDRRKSIERLMYGPMACNIHQADAYIAPCLDWVICGGETGAKARGMAPLWAQSLRDQCVAANTSFFFKQHGDYFGGKHLGRLLDGREWNEVPE